MRNRPTTAPDDPPDTREPDSGTLDGTLDTEHDTEHDAEHDTEPAWTEPVSEVDLGTEAEAEPEVRAAADADDEPAEQPATAAAPRVRRPAGKRRSAGTSRPDDLTAAEAGASTEAVVHRVRVDPKRRASRMYSTAAVLAVVAVLLVGLAGWFRGEADALDGDANSALTDSPATSEVIGKLTTAVEETFSYNYTDLASTEKAVERVLTGKARCEYDKLFEQVKKLAPEQKIIIATAVRDIALVRLDGDRAQALVFIDESSTRVDKNKSVAFEAQFEVHARREGDTWKITDFDMFDQKMVNDQPAPEC